MSADFVKHHSDFSTQYVVITGASRGIGFAMVNTFLNNGAHVIAIARSTTALEQLCGEHPQALSLINTDLTTREGCEGAVEKINALDIKLHCLINNAGIARFQPLEDIDEDSLSQQINLNLVAPLRLTRGLLPLFKHNASVINLSSYFSRRMLHDRPSSVYSATKGGLESLTRALAFELGPRQIRVNAIAPGSVRTSLFESNLEQLSEQQQQSFLTQIPQLYPLGRLGTPDDITQLAVFLASDKAQWISGAVFAIDGGLTTH